MRVLGYLRDRGMVLIDGKAAGEGDYDITIFQDTRAKSASGSMKADMDLLFRAFSSGKAQMRLHDGSVIDIILTELNGDHAMVTVSGPVAGF
jgi:hypothetical protein